MYDHSLWSQSRCVCDAVLISLETGEHVCEGFRLCGLFQKLITGNNEQFKQLCKL